MILLKMWIILKELKNLKDFSLVTTFMENNILLYLEFKPFSTNNKEEKKTTLKIKYMVPKSVLRLVA